MKRVSLYLIGMIFVVFDTALSQDIPHSPKPLPLPKPKITNISPVSGAPGSVVTVNGENLTHSIIFRSTNPNIDSPSTANFVSSNKIMFTVPSNLACGPYTIFVKGLSSGTVQAKSSNGVRFDILGSCLKPPKIDALITDTGSPGTVVTIVGSNFLPSAEVSFRLWHGHFFETVTVPVTTTFVSSSQLTFRVPEGVNCGNYVVQVKLLEILQLSNTKKFRVSCDNLADWQIRLESLEAYLAQESEDEPYIVVIGFHTKFLTPGSTSVFWSGVLDDEWADGIETGETHDIPKEMGVVTFPSVQLTELTEGNQFEVAYEKSELVGAVILAFESDWTPFSIIRDKMNELRDRLEEKLTSLIENFEIDIQNPESSFEQARNELESEIEGNLWDWIRSGFDADDLIGNRFPMFAATSGFREQSSKLSELTEGPFVLKFSGEDAIYFVRGSITSSALETSISSPIVVK